MAKKRKNRKRKNDHLMDHNCPVGLQHDRQYKHQGAGDYGYNPMTASNTGSKGNFKPSSLTHQQRKEKGIGMGADFGSWQAPSRRLNPHNKKDAKIISRGMDSINREKRPSLPCEGFNREKYRENFNEINWGNEEDSKLDKNGVRKPKKTKKVYK